MKAAGLAGGVVKPIDLGGRAVLLHVENGWVLFFAEDASEGMLHYELS